MLACARIGAVHSVIFGGFSATALVDRIADSKSKVLITADGGYRRGKIVPLKETADAALKNCPTIEKSIVVKRTGQDVELAGRPRSLVARIWRKQPRRIALPRISIPSTRSTSSIPAAQRGNPKACCTPRPATCCRCTWTSRLVFDLKDRRRVLVHRRHRMGDRAQLHRLRPAIERRHDRDVRRRAGSADQRPLLANRRALQGQHFLQLRHGGSRVHVLGHGMDRQARHQQPALARHGRRAYQSRGVEMVFRGHRQKSLSRSSIRGGRRKPARS